jgi:hypothetical protein
MENISQQLGELFQSHVFHIKLKDANIRAEITVEHFSVRKEKYSGDYLLYIQTNFEPQTLRDRKSIEKDVEREVRNLEIAQVIIPTSDFWNHQMIEESEYNSELMDFILHKLYKKIYRIKQFGHIIRFSVHPYEVKKNVLFIDVRDFSNSANKELDYHYFTKPITEMVLEDVYHLGVRKVEILTPAKKTKVLAESKEPIDLVHFKEYHDYITPAGVFSFTLTDTENEYNVLNYKVKDFHCNNGHEETFVINDLIQPYLEKIVRDDVKRYGFTDARFQGQTNSVIKESTDEEIANFIMKKLTKNLAPHYDGELIRFSWEGTWDKKDEFFVMEYNVRMRLLYYMKTFFNEFFVPFSLDENQYAVILSQWVEENNGGYSVNFIGGKVEGFKGWYSGFRRTEDSGWGHA